MSYITMTHISSNLEHTWNFLTAIQLIPKCQISASACYKNYISHTGNATLIRVLKVSVQLNKNNTK